ncbi:arsenate reductase ArsC [Desertibaculum subflavum]|uniref:arsenate reductase ArsC n=1 Tax=Desertibaculum subflavum TaxID=2268458 RepID=UPI000E67292C
MAKLPGAVLFACTSNVIRSPMAEAMLKYLHGNRIYVQSVGIRTGEPDPFVAEVMDEIGIDLTRHKPKTFDDLHDEYEEETESFDLVISLSPEAHHHAIEMTRNAAVDIEFWNTFDPSVVQGSREQILDAYRAVRDELFRKIRARFPRDPVAPA